MSFFIVLIIIVIYEIYKHPELGAVFAISLIGFGPIVDLIIGSSLKFAVIAAIFVIELFKAVKYRWINRTIVFFFICVLLKEFLALVLGQRTESLILAIYVYVILAGITYFSYKANIRAGGNFAKQYSFYIIGCLLIQFYRVFFDYSFFGLAMSDDIYNRYTDVYSYGNFSFRPSSLQTPINFSIELAVFMGMMLHRNPFKKYNWVLLICCLVGLLLTFSRSGLLVLLIALLWHMYKSHKPLGYSIIFITILFGLMVAFNYTDRFFEIFSLQGENASYDTRFGSMDLIMKQISNFGVKDFLFGMGVGSANTPQQNGELLFYVENYYLAVLVDSGIVALLFIILFLIYTIKNGWKNNKDFVVLSAAVMLTNLLSANLHAYTVNMLFLTLCFNAINSPKRTIVYERK